MNDQSLNARPLEVRLETYRRYADDALHQAGHTDDVKARATFLSVAAKWQRLVAHLEKTAPPGKEGNAGGAAQSRKPER